mgnify:CR=1 FL=1
MFNQKTLSDELTEYIKKNLKKGYTLDSLRVALTNQYYSKLEIDKAIKRAQSQLAEEAPILKTKPQIEHKVIEPKNAKIVPIQEKKSFFKRLFS